MYNSIDWFIMLPQEYLYDLLFEISSKERHQILLILREEAANLTYISKSSGLTLPETRRHVSRLLEVNLLERNPDGKYSLTYFGTRILELIEEISFFTQYKDYFLSHSVNFVPREFRTRIRELSDSEYHDNILNFIRRIDHVIREADNEVYLLVDQFPLNHLSLILETLERGVNFKIIEPQNRVINPDIEALLPHDRNALNKMRVTPLVEQRMLHEVNILLVASEKDCVIAFPTIEGDYDYKGFRSTDKTSLRWCRELFQQYWQTASNRTFSINEIEQLKEHELVIEGQYDQVVITGYERPEYDAQAIQDAVDRYNEVVLKGRFNLGTSTILIKRSIVLRGEGRSKDVPDTKIYKKGWSFPFLDPQYLFSIRGKDIDVVIENIHIENFNGTCISFVDANSIAFRKNRITLYSAHGRGLTFGKWGDHVVGIVTGASFQECGFPGGVYIENNYLDFALSYESGGFLSYDGREKEPGYRPNLFNHETPVCVGIKISGNSGKVVVANNIVRNMNSRGILICDNKSSSEVSVHNNLIASEVFGAYPYNNPMAGVGIFVQSTWSELVYGSKVKVFDNKIICDKVNYCGIAIHGPSFYQKDVGKLEKCTVQNNEIVLNDGLYGIQIRKSDNTKIINNKISGNVYYGLQINGSKNKHGIDLSSSNNIFADNDMEDLKIKPPDEYSESHIDGYTFAGTKNKSITSNIWINKHSNNNTMKIKKGQTIVDEGENSKVFYLD